MVGILNQVAIGLTVCVIVDLVKIAIQRIWRKKK